MSAPGYETLIYDRRDAAAWITLNRPHVLNAYNVRMRDDLFEVLSAVRDDPEVRVLVLCGKGRAFCAGADLSEFGTAPSPTAARSIRFARDVWAVFDQLPVPTIAALHGFVFGSGLEMALFCDLRLAEAGTQFGFPEVRLGMIPAAGGTQTLRRACGPGAAVDLLLTGRRIDAAEALRLSVVSRVVPPGQLEAETEATVRDVLSLDSRAVRATRRAVREGFDLPLHQALQLEARLATALVAHSSAMDDQ
jgi:enoyl-CoA hydratase/carnithine racemase